MVTRKEGELTPAQIVAELDKYIIGQEKAKKSVAIALRNRYRRKNLPEELRDEVAPKNIIMIGPTGVGKTEIARRLSNIAGAPFIKVEATKYTEVGYVGRDVDSMIRDLMNAAVNDVKKEMSDEVETLARDVRKPSGDLRLAHAGRTDHEDILGGHLGTHVRGQLPAAPAIADSDGHGPCGVMLTDDVPVQGRYDGPRRQDTEPIRGGDLARHALHTNSSTTRCVFV